MKTKSMPIIWERPKCKRCGALLVCPGFCRGCEELAKARAEVRVTIPDDKWIEPADLREN